MKHNTLLALFLATCLLVLAGLAPAYSAGTYKIVDLGTLPGGGHSGALAINTAGQMVGWSETYLKGAYETHAFHMQKNLRIRDLGTLGGNYSAAYGINDAGQVVGGSRTKSGEIHAFLWTDKTRLKDLGTLRGRNSSIARAINNQGRIVGESEVIASGVATQRHVFLWTAKDGMKDLGALPGGNFATPLAINAAGQVIGYSDTLVNGNIETHAFLWTAKGGMKDLGTLGGGASWAYGINNAGQIVGSSLTRSGSRHAFQWTQKGGLKDLSTFNGEWSWATAINNRGLTVGGLYDSGLGIGKPCARQSNGQITPLPVLNPSGSGAPADVNDKGQIVGVASDHAVLWTIQ
jgi:probable HAF family extracellular repeat protein